MLTPGQVQTLTILRTRVLSIALAAFALLLVSASAASAHDFNPCKLTLSPKTAINPLGTQHTVTAYVTYRGGNNYITAGQQCAAGGAGPAVGWLVNFEVLSGPNAGLTGSGVTGADGKTSFTWPSTTPGTDTIKAWIKRKGCGIDLLPGQTIDTHCPAHEIYFEYYTDTATKKWIDPYDPGGGPDDCTENPYYYDSIYCPPTGDGGHAQKNKASVAFLLGKRCKSRAFKVRPTYSDGIVAWSRLQLNGKKVKTLKAPPFTFKLGVKKLRSGKKYRLRLTTAFTSGETIVLKGTFKRCGKPKRKR